MKHTKWEKFSITFVLLFGHLCLSYSVMCGFPQMNSFIQSPLNGNVAWIKTFFISAFCIACGLGIYLPMMSLPKLEPTEDTKAYVSVICIAFFTLVLMYFGYRGSVLSSHFLTNIFAIISYLGYHYLRGTHFWAFDDLARMVDYQSKLDDFKDEKPSRWDTKDKSTY